MQIWNNKTAKDILKSLEGEIAKAQNEISCAKGDIDKAQGRLQFSLSALNNLKNRDIEEKRK